jgi:hypothetical protein
MMLLYRGWDMAEKMPARRMAIMKVRIMEIKTIDMRSTMTSTMIFFKAERSISPTHKLPDHKNEIA